MKKRLFSLWFSLFSLFITVLFFPTILKAQIDNNQIAYECNINVNGVQAVTSNGQNEPPSQQIPIAPTIGGSPLASFPVSVTLSDAARQALENCSQTLPTELFLSSVTGSFNGWEEHILSGNGTTFTTNIQVLNNFDKNYVVALDVELPRNNLPGSCIALAPVCRRAYVKLNPGAIENYESSCQEKRDRFALDFSLLSLGGADQMGNYSFEGGTPVNLTVDNDIYSSVIDSCSGDKVRMRIINVDTGEIVASSSNVGTRDRSVLISYANTNPGNYRLILDFSQSNFPCAVNDGNCIHYQVTRDFCTYEPGTGSCTPLETDADGETPAQPYLLCNQVPGLEDKEACNNCLNQSGIWTAIGCVPQNPAQAVGVLVSIGLNIAGGVALIMILAAGFMMTTSQGEPKKLGDAKDLMQSAVIGLLFIIFSVTILQFIGSDLLKIPGFGNN